MAENLPAIVTPPDFERIASGDSNAIRDALLEIWKGLNAEIIGRHQILEPLLSEQITALVASRGTLAEQPTLGLSEAGRYYFVTDFGHLCYWTGTVWEFAPGDIGNGFLALFAVAPQENGWQLCDGSATTRLVVGGATLTTAAFTTPNLTGTPAFPKSAAAYSGAIDAAVAPGIAGATGSTAPALSGTTASAAPGVNGSTATGGSHTHSGTWITGGPSFTQTVDANLDGLTQSVGSGTHDHNVPAAPTAGDHSHGAGTLAVDSHGHGVGTLAVAGHTHPAGTLAVDAAARPPSIGVLPYFRR